MAQHMTTTTDFIQSEFVQEFALIIVREVDVEIVVHRKILFGTFSISHGLFVIIATLTKPLPFVSENLVTRKASNRNNHSYSSVVY